MKTVLITGAGGEVGYTLTAELKKEGYKVVALSLHNLPPEQTKITDVFYRGDVSDYKFVEKIFDKHEIEVVFHLASILSTGGERNPELAITVNAVGTQNTMEVATKKSLETGKSVKFIFPSSIAAYGIPDLKEKSKKPKVKEEDFTSPITIYGVTKLYAENLGLYFSKHYKLLDDLDRSNLIDFRCVRFPGLLSPDTLPSGGTSDYGPEMFHSAAQGKPYACFVRPDSTIPFMAMEDGVRVLMLLAKAPKKDIKSSIYNVSGFSASAKDIEKEIKHLFPKAEITYKIHMLRQRIIDSWPADVDDSKAQKEWGWKPKYNFKKTFEGYLLPKIKERYGIK